MLFFAGRVDIASDPTGTPPYEESLSAFSFGTTPRADSYLAHQQGLARGKRDIASGTWSTKAPVFKLGGDNWQEEADESIPSDSLASSQALPVSRSLSPARMGSALHEDPANLDIRVDILPSNLAMIGLNKEAESRFESRIQRFLGWPEKQGRSARQSSDGFRPRPSSLYSSASSSSSSDVWLPSSFPGTGPSLLGLEGVPYPDATEAARHSSPPLANHRPFFSYVRTEDGTSLATEIPILRALFDNDEDGSGERFVQSAGELDIFDDISLSPTSSTDFEDRGRAIVRSWATLPVAPRALDDLESTASSPLLYLRKIRREDELSPALIPTRDSSPDTRERERGVKRCLQVTLLENGDALGESHA